MAIDNKGHRFAGPAMSLGATFFDDEGNFDLEDDEGFRAFAVILKDLIDAGKSPAETWLGTSQYTGAQDYFINVETVMYFSGSWQIGRFSPLISAMPSIGSWRRIPTGRAAAPASPVALLSSAMPRRNIRKKWRW